MFENIKINSIISLTIASLTMGLTGCGNKVAEAQAKPKVVATHNVICDLVETIAQDTIDLTCLIDGSQDPHTYRPTPSQRKAIEEAQLIFYGGYQLEPQIIKLFAENSVPKIPLYEQAVAEPIQVEHSHGHEEHEHEEHEHEEHEHEEHGHEEHEHEEHGDKEKPKQKKKADLEPDPHVWHNVENTVAMVELLRSLFLQANPTAADMYLKNSVELTENLWQLDAWIKDQVATIPEGQKVLVTTHNSLNYYASAYRLEDYKSLQGLSSASSATASQVRTLAREIKEIGIPTIFAESTASDRVISNVARTADVELSTEKLIVDGLGTTDGYIEMMSYNTCAIVDGLGGECKPFDQ